jgi:hypothetical protein
MPRATEPLRLEGRTVFDNGEYAMYHQETTLIASDHVESLFVGLGPGCEAVPPVASDDPAVIDYERRKYEARQISAYRNRPIKSIFKTQRRSRRGKQ